MKLSLRVAYRLAVITALVSVASASAAEMTPESLKAVETRVKAVVEKALPCTVALTSERTGAAGSGVVVSKEGLILTAGHVTRATGDELLVFFPNGKVVRATALGADYGRDSGMARIIDEGEYPFVEMGESKTLKENEWCVALGHTSGYQSDRTPPVRLGRILGTRVQRFISTDCALTGGDSGGPLFDLDGELIGIHSNIGNSLMENRHIPIDTYQTQWKDMLEGARLNDSNGPMLGVYLGEEMKDGVKVEVMPEGPASEAGLKTDDIILSVKGKPTRNGDDLLLEISKCRVGKAAEVEILRGDERLSLKVTPKNRRQVERRGGNRRGRRRGPGPQLEQPQKEDPPKEDPAKEDPPKEDESKEDDGRDDAAHEKLADEASKTPAPSGTTEQPAKEAPEEADSPGEESDEKSEAERIRELEEELAKRIKDASENGGDVEVPPELMKMYPNLGDLRKRMADFLGRNFSFAPGGEDKFFTEVISGYRPIVDDAAESVVKIMVGPKQVALGTVVREDGFILTKASEVKDVTATVQLPDGQRFAASLEKEFAEYDLALLKVPKKLNAIQFSAVSDELPLGSFVTAVGVDPTPLAIGVLSVARRSLAAKDRPFLGVALRADEDGLAIQTVVDDSAASKAGLREGDVVRTLDGKSYSAVPLFIQSLGRRRPGDEIKLQIVRDGKEFEQLVKLGGRTELPAEPGRGRYPTGGKLSEQRDGYPNALQTDLPFRFNECGSPLVDLDGRIVGVNIARAGRTKSYAIPAGTICKLVEEALPE